MNIGIDIDNVLSNFNDVLLEDYLKHDKELRNNGIVNKEKYITRGMFDWSEDEERSYYKNNIERIAKDFEPIKDCSKYIKELRQDGHLIFIISGRDNGEYSDPYNMTIEWLKKYDIEYDKLILTNAYKHQEKADYCKQNNIDIMIDDSIHVCEKCAENNIDCILFETPYNKKENRFNKVSNWKELYKFLSNYKKKKNIKLSFAEKILISDQAVGKIISVFLDVFLAAYFYKISDKNILYLCIYNIIGWIVATFGALIVKNYIKSKNKVQLYRFGTIIKAIYIFTIIVLGEKIINYVWLIGILYGISTATTGFPYNMIESENVNNKERAKYIGYSTVITEIISLIVPILLGAYISLKSYQIAGVLIFVFSLIKVILTFKIKNKNIINDKTNLKQFFQIYKNDKYLKKLYWIEFFKGINRYGVMSLVVSLLIIYNSNNELELGGWTSIFSLATIISMYVFGRKYTKKNKKAILITSLITMIISFLAILLKINFTTIIIYDIVYYTFMNIVLKITEIDLFDYSNKEPYKNKYNTEYFVFREIFLNTARTIGYVLLLLLVGLRMNLANLEIIFVVIVFSIIMTIYLSLCLDKTKLEEHFKIGDNK